MFPFRVIQANPNTTNLLVIRCGVKTTTILVRHHPNFDVQKMKRKHSKRHVIAYYGVVSVTSLQLSATIMRGGIDLEDDSSLITLNLPNLTQIDPDSSGAGQFYLSNCSVLESINAPNFASSTSTIQIDGLTSTNFTSIAFPALVTCVTISITNCPSLANLDFSSFVPTNGKMYQFNNDGLSVTSIDGFLARCVANAAYVSGTINVSGGTNAAPTQGAGSAHDILVARGVTITHN